MRPWLACLLLSIACGSSTQPSLPDGATTSDALIDGRTVDGPAADAPADLATTADLGGDLTTDVPCTGGCIEAGNDGALEASAADLAAPDAPPIQPTPYGPFPGCTPQLGTTCDLVCQSGCAPGQRCELTAGAVSCQAQAPPFQDVTDGCMPADDRCRPGSICLQESDDRPACGAHCYRHCRDNSDCRNGAVCYIDVQFGSGPANAKVCTQPPEPCNPFGSARCARTDRPYPTFACYVMSSNNPDLPICDCAGTVKLGDPCTYEHQCEPGSECVSVPQGARICRRVCKVGALTQPDGGCPVGQLCTAFPKGKVFGYCH